MDGLYYFFTAEKVLPHEYKSVWEHVTGVLSEMFSGSVETVEVQLSYFPIYLLHGTESSWAAYWFAASQEIPRISRNPKFHYRTHKRLPPVSILGQHIPVHIPHIPPPGDSS